MSERLPSFDRAEYLHGSTMAGSTTAGPQTDQLRQPSRLHLAEGARRAYPVSASHAAFARALVFGVGAAIAGMLLYAGVEIATGWIIGYVAIAVGYLVGKAMKMGSGGRGGRRYQIAAVVLTYIAVSMAAIPVGIHAYNRESSGHKVKRVDQAASSVASHEAGAEAESSRAGGGQVLLTLLGAGLESPFLDIREGAGGLIGLFILFLGMRAAWKLTADPETAAD